MTTPDPADEPAGATGPSSRRLIVIFGSIIVGLVIVIGIIMTTVLNNMAQQQKEAECGQYSGVDYFMCMDRP